MEEEKKVRELTAMTTFKYIGTKTQIWGALLGLFIHFIILYKTKD